MSDDNPQWAGEERRRTLRFGRALEVTCRIADSQAGPSQVQSKNVSVGGILLRMPEPLPEGCRLELSFAGHGEEMQIQLTGAVKRCVQLPRQSGYEVGVEFTGVDASQRNAILSLAPGQPKGVEGWQNREYVRLPSSMPVRYKKAGLLATWREATTRNLGVGGAMLETPRNIRPGAHLNVELELGKDNLLKLPAVVVDSSRPDEDGPFRISVMWIAPPDQARKLIATYVTQGFSRRPARTT